jgi:energy-converting hydrogenase Eha subunit B
MNKRVKSEIGPILWGLLFAFGILLFFNGMIGALSSTTTISLSGIKTVTYPRLYVGILLSVAGSIIAIVAFYGIRHGTSRILQLQRSKETKLN